MVLFVQVKKSAGAILAAAALLWMTNSAVAAPTQFAQFTNNGANDAANGLHWVNTDNNSAVFSTSSGGAAVSFSFTNIPGLSAALQGPQSAHLSLMTGTSTNGQSLFGQVLQPIDQTLVMSFTRDTPLGGLSNLLTVTVTPSANMAVVSGQNGSASLNAASPGQTITFSSDFYDFSNVTSTGAGITLSGILSGLSFNTDHGNSILNSFSAAAVGSFTADLKPVPEPGSLALLGISGLVLCGVRYRAARRKA